MSEQFDLLVKQVDELAEAELVSANQRFAGFASAHEAYAVTQEELEEAIYATNQTGARVQRLWEKTKRNANMVEKGIEVQKVCECAENAAAEMIQLAAMAKKWRTSGVAAYPTEIKAAATEQYCSQDDTDTSKQLHLSGSRTYEKPALEEMQNAESEKILRGACNV